MNTPTGKDYAALDQHSLKAAKARLVQAMLPYGLDVTDDVTVARPRKGRPGVVGYYARMSQFRSRARIVVDAIAIRQGLEEIGQDDEDFEAEVRHEIQVTVGHEYGHSVAEALRFLTYIDRSLSVPDWRRHFGDDEEAMAESLGCLLAGTPRSEDSAFWSDFLPQFGTEMAREKRRAAQSVVGPVAGSQVCGTVGRSQSINPERKSHANRP
ncbi:MAG: hypothetical protein E6R08_10310 [Nevskiaceae bacterium]|nr:MAG: hypothetical protein E6R08_10310 [Nevskiaceae bacterium]